MLFFKKNVLESESGLFHIDKDGMLMNFQPSGNNPIIEEKTEEPCAYYGYVIRKSIQHLVIPRGIRSFADDMFRGITVKERLELPEELISIGNTVSDGNYHGCVFSHCVLPEVIIPESVKELGSFAFGGSHIDYLRIPSGVKSPYLRQFKESYIDTLCLPKKWKDAFLLEGTLLRKNDCFDKMFGHNWHKTHGYLTFDASIGHLKFA